MKKGLYRTGLAFSIILFFISANVILNVSGGSKNNILKHSSNSYSRAEQIIFIAVTNSFSNDISIYHSDDIGGLNHYIDYPLGDNPTQIITDDFNFDEIPDLIVTNYHNADVNVLLGDGFGGFVSRQNFFCGGSPLDISTNDFNNDNVLDIAIVDLENDDVSILLGDGFGGFSKPQWFPTGMEPEGIATGDFNNDGNIDYAVTNTVMMGQYGNIDIFLGDGTGSFSFHGEHTVYNVPSCIIAEDFKTGEKRKK